MIWECIYHRRYGGQFIRFLCCHVWKINVLHKNKEDTLRVERNRCIDCGRNEILILVKHNKEI